MRPVGPVIVTLSRASALTLARLARQEAATLDDDARQRIAPSARRMLRLQADQHIALAQILESAADA